MGISNLNKFLRKKCPSVFKEIHISEFAYKKVAIDITLFLCKFKAVCGENWVTAFINLVASLRRNEIHCVFIFDNGAPDEKSGEREERKKQQEQIKKKVFDLETAFEKYTNTGEIDVSLRELYEKMPDSEKNVPRLLMTRKNNEIDMKAVEQKIKKMKNYILNITANDFEIAKELFEKLHVPYYLAALEAECTCADLCRRGYVDAVLTEDTDVLAYGSPVFLSKINTTDDTCVQINHDDVLRELNITHSQFLDLCIMFGCDYNKNIHKVGIETSYKYLKTYGSIDNIEKELKLDVSSLNHIRCRELFTQYGRIDIPKNIPYCGIPDMLKLKEFVDKYKLFGLNYEKLKTHFTKQSKLVVLLEDEDTDII